MGVVVLGRRGKTRAGSSYFTSPRRREVPSSRRPPLCSSNLDVAESWIDKRTSTGGFSPRGPQWGMTATTVGSDAPPDALMGRAQAARPFRAMSASTDQIMPELDVRGCREVQGAQSCTTATIMMLVVSGVSAIEGLTPNGEFAAYPLHPPQRPD